MFDFELIAQIEGSLNHDLNPVTGGSLTEALEVHESPIGSPSREVGDFVHAPTLTRTEAQVDCVTQESVIVPTKNLGMHPEGRTVVGDITNKIDDLDERGLGQFELTLSWQYCE